MRFELEERVEKFGENIIDVVKKIRINYLNKSIIEQLIRSGTSIGANYFEANGSSSKKDFINKIYDLLFTIFLIFNPTEAPSKFPANINNPISGPAEGVFVAPTTCFSIQS